MANIWERMETVTDLVFLSSKITVDDDCSHEIKRRLLLGQFLKNSKEKLDDKYLHEINWPFGGWSQDGRGIGWEDHFLSHKFIKSSFECWVTSTKQLNAGGGHQAPRKAAHSLQKEGCDYWLDCPLPF